MLGTPTATEGLLLSGVEGDVTSGTAGGGDMAWESFNADVCMTQSAVVVYGVRMFVCLFGFSRGLFVSEAEFV